MIFLAHAGNGPVYLGIMIMRKPSHPLPFLPTHLFVGSVLLFASQFAVLTPATASESYLRLDCEFSKFRNTGYAKEFARTWIAPTQTHIFEENAVTYDSAGISFRRNSGKINKRDTKRIE